MKPSGTGRIIFWSGGSLWIGLSGEQTRFHSHHAVQITLSFSKEGVNFCRPGENWKSCQTAIIAAHQAHAFEARDKYVGMIFVEPESREGRVLGKLYASDGISTVADGIINHETNALFHCYTNKGADFELAAAARAVISTLTATTLFEDAGIDKRIRKAKEVIRERIGETIRLAEIADAIHLSPDRFRHLFLEETGIRFRPYILWLRIEIALSSYVANRSLTEASHAGGFADSAHFSRTFMRMFGIAPSSILLE